MKIGDIVKGELGHEGPITKIENGRVTFQITKKKLKMDFTDYDVDGGPIVWSHLVMESPINRVELIKKK